MSAARRAGLLATALAGVLALALWLAGSGADGESAQPAPAVRATPPAPASALPDVAPPSVAPPSVAQAEPLLSPARGLRAHLATDAVPVVPVHVELLGEGDHILDRRTCAAGEVRWDDLPPGRYRLRALGSAWDVPAADLELAAGEERDVELRPLTLLAGRVLGARSGQPLAAYELSAWRHDFEGPQAGEPELLHSGPVADPEGRFALAGIELPAEPGVQVQVTVYTEARVSVSGPRLDAPPDARWTSIELRAPEPLVTGRVRLEGVPETKHVDASVALVNEIVGLRNLRVDEDGDPWFVMGSGEAGRVAGFPTTADGRFVISLPEAPAAPQRLLAVAGEWLPYLSEPFVVPAPGPPLELDVTLQQGGRVEGTVNLPAGAPGATRPAAWPTLAIARPAGALVGQAPDQVAATPGYEPHGPEDPAYFTLAGLFPGEHDIEVQVMPLDAPPGRSLTPRRLTARVTVAAGEATPLVLDYDAAAAGLVLRGRLRLPPEIPAERAHVGLFRPEPGDQRSKPLHQSTVAADGRFELAGLDPGAWLLVASAMDKDSRILALAAHEPPLDERAPEQDLDLTAPALQLVAGAGRGGQRVAIAGSTGLPAFDLLVAQGALGAKVPADGVVRFYGLPPGRYEAVLGDTRTPFELAAGSASRVVALP